MIYKYALDRIPKQDAQNLFKNYTIFEKKFGDRRGIEEIIVSKRRFQYEEEVKVRVTNALRLLTQPAAASGTGVSRDVEADEFYPTLDTQSENIPIILTVQLVCLHLNVCRYNKDTNAF